MKADAPIMGGMSMPPVLAAASTAPAKWGMYPTLFMRGMVKAPVVATLAWALPEMLPIRAEATTATLAGPPRYLPARAREKSLKNSLVLDAARNAPKRINMKT